MKSASELLANKKAKLEYQLTSSKKPCSSMPADTTEHHGSLSHLETLPIELVQQIFFHCLEVNMIKASPVISKMLSTDSTYKLLILFAFFDDDGIHPVEIHNFRPVTYRELPVEEKIRLQEAILSCRWCSLQRIQACVPTLTRLKIVQEWYKEHNTIKSWPTDPPLISSSRASPPALPSLDDNPALENYFHVHPGDTDADGIIVPDQTQYLPWLRPYDVRLSRDGFLIKQVHHIGAGHRRMFTSTLAARHIPDKLLTGRPWTLEKLNFLKLLRQGFRHLTGDFILHISPHALFHGMADAIKENNTTALLVLLELHDAAFHIKNTTMDSHTVQNHNPHNQLYTTPLSHPLPLSLFHLTTKHAYKEAEPLLSLLIRGGLDSLPKDDTIMTKWALTATAADPAIDSIAAFILTYMEGGLADFEGDGIFRHGRLVAEFPQRFQWSGVGSFAEEIGYEGPRRDWQFSVQVETGGFV